MILDFTEKKKVKIDMRFYVKAMIDEFGLKLLKGGLVSLPASDKLFKINKTSPDLAKE